jgi:hypothetical protein
MCESSDYDGRTTVIINEDGSVYPFMCVFDLANEGEDELRDMIKDYLESKGRKLGTFYKWS